MNTMMMIGFLFIGCGLGLGLIVMSRLTRVGNKKAIQGPLAWVEYVRISKEHGWSSGLVFWMLGSFLTGIALVVFGVKCSGYG
jgi:hypothetical protein